MSIAKDLQDKIYNERKETGKFPSCIHIESSDFIQLWYELDLPVDPELPFKRGLVGKIFGIDLYVEGKEGEKMTPDNAIKKTSLRDEIERIGKAGHTVTVTYNPDDGLWRIEIKPDIKVATSKPVRTLRQCKT